MNTFSTTTTVNRTEYVKLNFKLLYAKKWVMVISILAFLFLVFSIVSYITHNDAVFNSDFYSFWLIIFTMAFWLPIATLIMAIRAYKTNKSLHYPIVYELSEEGVKITGDLFLTQFKWEKLIKVKVSGNWLLLYQTKASATFIKMDEANAANIEKLKQYLKIYSPKVKTYVAKPV